MLEKDPVKRVSAEAALNHPCFMSEMDIEKDVKMTAFKEITNTSTPTYYLKSKDLEMTPSCMNQGKKEEKAQYFESARREGARQYLYS
jgi:serine/threonine protein kinase